MNRLIEGLESIKVLFDTKAKQSENAGYWKDFAGIIADAISTITEKTQRIENMETMIEDMEERIAIMSEGDTEAMLNKACETIANFNLDFVCDDNTLDDGWCNEHCKAAGQKPECFRHWLMKQTTEPPKEGEAE